ncbi:hypothetical protein, partial [Salmonella sp. s51884]|uniref:hypothetical protein n=1 Tax=Salmonella sp. s51884 TaxID=3159654 RepID=UPI00398095AD
MLDAFKKCRKKTQILRVEKGGFPSLDNKEYKCRIKKAGFDQIQQGLGGYLTDRKKPCSFLVVETKKIQGL